MATVSSDSFYVWLKTNPVVLIFAVLFMGIFISLFTMNVDDSTISRGEMIAISISLLSGFVSFYFGIEMLSLQQEVHEYRDELKEK
jgi:hypothetical protein